MAIRPDRCEQVLVLLSDGEWHTTAEISSASVGGTEGTRRLRELRADGCAIEKRKVPGSTQYEYRWAHGRIAGTPYVSSWYRGAAV